MKQIISIFFLLLPLAALTQKTAAIDTSIVEVRNLSVKQYTGKDFNYSEKSALPKSIWDRIWDWFWQQIDEMLSTPKGRTRFWTIIIVVGAFVLGYFIWKLTGMNRAGFFSRDSGKKLYYTMGDDDIHQINFTEEINKAAASGNFRMAIRLHYLQVLKLLSDNKYIVWKMDKTNAMYVDELANTSLNESFAGITVLFDYVWYGDAIVDAEAYQKAAISFNQFQQKILQ